MRLIFLVCATWVLFTCRAQDPPEGKCQLDGVGEKEWIEYYENDPVDDNEKGPFKEFVATNVIGAELNRDSDHHKYFKVSLNTDKTLLTIGPSDQFENFEKEINSEKDFQFRIRIEFKCNNSEMTLSFRQPINDLNTYPPVFPKSSYDYKLPMPLPQNFEITLFGEEIIATDYDISNVEVTFTITPDDKFYVSSLGPTDATNKHHKASVKVKEVLRLDDNATYFLTVTDTGTPTKNTTTQLNLMIDKQIELLPNPFFTKAYYAADYNANGEKHSITLKDAIELERGCSDTILDIDNKESFHVSCIENKIIVELIKNLDESVLENNAVVLVTIDATLEKAEKPGYTVLVVYLPKQECPETTTPQPPEEKQIKFEKDSYWFDIKSSYIGDLGFVKPLTKDNLIVLTIEGTMLEDLESIIKKLSEQTKMELRYLTAAVLPSAEKENRISRSTKTTLLRYFQKLVHYDDKDYSATLILYGLDGNKPIKKKELEEALDKSELAESFSSEDWKQCLLYDNDDDQNGEKENCDDDDDTVYIIVIAVLASILVIFIIAAAVFYYLRIYRKRQSEPYLNMDEEDGQDSNSISFEKNPRASSVSKSEDIAKRRPTGFIFNPPPIEEDEDIFGERNAPKYEQPSYARNNGYQNIQNEYAEPTDAVDSNVNKQKKDDFHDYAEITDTFENPTEDPDRPKSVKFKETVEKINIVVDDPDKQDDDLLDERL
ncbi:hypothetical protein ILUMI_24494 [Ignelater luminosus]|uniref:Cadherin domain-containing protein n=1 Tax=Ignelater luminosus TaxID=2038154 RepID=A0A8K0FYN1_IGNLU|nr:hypothetical protein ILUMI_24494 [Ignelater luminosus]